MYPSGNVLSIVMVTKRVVLFVIGPSAEPRNIRVFIESSLLVTITWGLPIERERNGIVISYEIYCVVSGSTESSTTETVLVANAIFDSPSVQSYQVSAKLHSTYVCRVSAATVNGSGPASVPSNFTVELPELAVSKNGDDSVIVRWEVPQVAAGSSSVQSMVNLVYYVVGSSEAKTNISVSAHLTDRTISNLGEIERMHACIHFACVWCVHGVEFLFCVYNRYRSALCRDSGSWCVQHCCYKYT